MKLVGRQLDWIFCVIYSTYSAALFEAKNISSIAGVPLKAEIDYHLKDGKKENVMKANQKVELKKIDGKQYGEVNI